MGIGAVMLKKAIFLDRDGVLNAAIVKDGKPYSPTLDELTLFTDTPEALMLLKKQNFLLICVTNQPEVARGTITAESVKHIHHHLMAQLPLDDVRACFHDDSDHCACRKPSPGLLLTAAKDYNIDLSKSFMIGDRWKDIEAGQRAGCRTIWLDRHYLEKKPDGPTFTTQTLLQAAMWIINL